VLNRTWIRIAASYALLVLLSTGVLAALLAGEFERHEEEALGARLADEARGVAYAALPHLTGESPREGLGSLVTDMARLYGTRVTLIGADGAVLADSEEDPAQMENHAARPEVARVLADPSATGSSSRLSATVGRRLLYVAAGIPQPPVSGDLLGVARVAYPLTSVEAARWALFLNAGLTLLLVTLPAILLGALLAPVVLAGATSQHAPLPPTRTR
jgi:two-component system phosphate regulon sensor histidine kinase PhoR